MPYNRIAAFFCGLLIPMKIEKILREISRALYESENGQTINNQYKELQKHEGWKVHQGFLVEIANRLAGAMLTKEFTALSKEEKDAMQRGIFIAKEVIDFLIDPIKSAKRYAAIKNFNQQMETTFKGNDRQKGSNR